MTTEHRLSGRDGRQVIYIFSTILLLCGLAARLPAWGTVALVTWCSMTLANCAFDLAQLGSQNEKTRKNLDEMHRRLEETRQRLIQTEQQRDQAIAARRAHTEAEGRAPGRGGLRHLLWQAFSRKKPSPSSNGQPASSRPGC